MAALVCDLCGGKLVGKPGEVFQCDSCGTEYSKEWAQSKVREIQGTVKVEGTVHVDSSHLTSNYLSMAKNALNAGNNAEAEKYCNKILELDPFSHEAWFTKGKAIGWQSTLGNQRIGETISAFSNALEHCPDEEKRNMETECKQEIENLHKALLSVRMQNFMNHPNDNDLAELTDDVKNILLNSVNFLVKAGINIDIFGKELGSVIANAVVNNFNAKILQEYRGDDGRPGDYEFKRFMSETDFCVNALNLAATLFGSDDTDDLELLDWRALTYDFMVTLNTAVRDSCSWDYNINDWGKSYYKNLTLNSSAIFARNTQNSQWEAEARKWRTKKTQKENAINAEKELKAKKEAKKRFEEYWVANAEEKAKLKAEQKDLRNQIDALNSTKNEQLSAQDNEIAAIPGASEIAIFDERIEKLTEEKAALGIFKGKEKKSLQEQIGHAIAGKKAVKDRMDAAKKAIDARIASAVIEIQNKIDPLQSRMNAINDELTKPR